MGSTMSSEAVPGASLRPIASEKLMEVDPPLSRRVSTSPPPVVETENAPPPSNNKLKDVAEPRRSTREKTSTLVYIDGQAVKRDNNYVLKGGTYHFNQQGVSSAPPSRAKTTARPKSTAPYQPRKVSAEEQLRAKFKTNVEQRTNEKQTLRQAFFHRHASILAPFVEPKIYARLAFAPPPISTATIDTTLDMQPDGIVGDMRDYQLQGLQFMSRMYRQNVGMILGDEMGLGKTLQAISLVCHLKERYGVEGPSLVICPLSVLYSWGAEITKWAPSLKHLRLHSSATELMDTSNLHEYDIVVTTYEMVASKNLSNVWRRQHFNLCILDEGHRIKNREALVSAAVRGVHCESRIILTGTPLANNLIELWSLLEFLAPDVFTTSEPFAEAFDLIKNVVDPVKLEQAHKVLQCFMLRRLKTEVEKLMPKKIETKIVCPLSNMQIWWYKAILLKDINILAKGGGSNARILNNLLMQLRKCCIHPFLHPGAEPDIDATTLEDLIGASGKLAVLDKLLCSLYQKSHRVVLFSQFTSVLDLLDDYARMRNFCRFDGSTPRAQRNYIVNSFNADGSEKFLFLMSTRSGGMGLNLQTADTVVLFDSDWNPQPDIQAMARVHRIGQKKTVHVYRLVTEGTVEQRMVERAEKKLYLDRMVTREGNSDELVSEEEDVGKLMATLKFGCNAVFGKDTKQNTLPTDEDIGLITDRTRTEDFTQGKLQGGVDETADGFDAKKAFTSTTDFRGIDFQKIREQYRKQAPDNMNHITDMWRKRQRKNRIKMIDGAGSGYGLASVPVLAANDYDLETGERSVFQQELRGRQSGVPGRKKKSGPTFENQDFCQGCGDGGLLVCCGRCPVSLHLECAGVTDAKQFMWCSHHHCSVCDKSATAAGGFLFPCSWCTSCFCEDHLPTGARFLETCDRMHSLGHSIKNGIYIHCSKACENVAIKEFGYKHPVKTGKPPCPAAIDVSSKFGGEVDDTLDAPEELIITGKRKRKQPVNYSPAEPSSSALKRQQVQRPVSIDNDSSESEEEDAEPYMMPTSQTESSDDEVMFVRTVPAPKISTAAPSHAAVAPTATLGSAAAAAKPRLFTTAAQLPEVRPAASVDPVGTKAKATTSSVTQTSAPMIASAVGSTPRFAPLPLASVPSPAQPQRTESAYHLFFRQEKARDAYNLAQMPLEQSMTVIQHRWNALTPEHVTSYENQARALNRQQLLGRDVYEVALPVTDRGLLIKISNTGGATTGPTTVVFLDYSQLPNGEMGPAEKAGLFHSKKDIIEAVDGISCIGKSFADVKAMLTNTHGKEVKVLSMRRGNA